MKTLSGTWYIVIFPFCHQISYPILVGYNEVAVTEGISSVLELLPWNMPYDQGNVQFGTS